MSIKNILALVLCSRGKIAFLKKLEEDVSILDVGCGNDSPFLVKNMLPQCKYTGIDVGDYNQKKPNLADNYILVERNSFSQKIFRLGEKFDVVVSSHNLEHCDDRDGTFNAMLNAIKPEGLLYLSFPCAESVDFPCRSGTLNYYDDHTHKNLPPDFDKIISELLASNFEIIYSSRRYQPKILWMIGMMLEPLSRYKKKVLRGTWEYYGFESIIWAKRLE